MKVNCLVCFSCLFFLNFHLFLAFGVTLFFNIREITGIAFRSIKFDLLMFILIPQSIIHIFMV